MQILTEQLMHDLIIHEVKNKYARIHKEVHINPGEEKNFEIQGLYPDVIFGGYGQIIQVVEVEIENNLNKERVPYWEKVASLGIPCTILVAKRNQRMLNDLLWKTGLMGKVKVALFDIIFENL
jgi:hypothetical protein